MKPKEYFKKTIIGKLITRTIKELSLDGVPSSIEDEHEYDVIDQVKLDDGSIMYVVNEWENEAQHIVLAIHQNFIKDVKID